METLTLKRSFPEEKEKKVILSLDKGENSELFSVNTTKLQNDISKELFKIRNGKNRLIRNIIFGKENIEITFSGTWTNLHNFQIQKVFENNIPDIVFL